MATGEMRRFRRDPLGHLEEAAHRSPGEVFPLPWGAWCVRDTDLALTVLRDPVFNSGPSPFFGELLPDRTAQIALGRAVRQATRAQLPCFREVMTRAVAELPAVTRWPGAGLALVHRGTAEALLRPGATPALRHLMERAVGGGLMGRPDRMRQRARAEVLRSRLWSALTTHVAERRSSVERPPDRPDLLDTVLAVCPAGLPDATVARLYALLFRSIVGTVGHSLAWAVLLACLHRSPDPGWSADRIAREAARHRPVVWMIGRRVPRRMEFGGLTFPPGTVLSVSPYLVHHDERHWVRPWAFRPERWNDGEAPGPYLPFSAGPFTCAGAAVAHTLVAEAFAALTAGAELSVERGDTRPLVTDAAHTRPFALRRTPAQTPSMPTRAPERR